MPPCFIVMLQSSSVVDFNIRSTDEMEILLGHHDVSIFHVRFMPSIAAARREAIRIVTHHGNEQLFFCDVLITFRATRNAFHVETAYDSY